MRDFSLRLFVKALGHLAMFGFAFLGIAAMALGQDIPASSSAANPYMGLMLAARRHAEAHGVKVAPVLSPLDVTLLGEHPAVEGRCGAAGLPGEVCGVGAPRRAGVAAGEHAALV